MNQTELRQWAERTLPGVRIEIKVSGVSLIDPARALVDLTDCEIPVDIRQSLRVYEAVKQWMKDNFDWDADTILIDFGIEIIVISPPSEVPS